MKLQIVSLLLQITIYTETPVSSFLQIGFNLFTNSGSPFLVIQDRRFYKYRLINFELSATYYWFIFRQCFYFPALTDLYHLAIFLPQKGLDGSSFSLSPCLNLLLTDFRLEMTRNPKSSRVKNKSKTSSVKQEETGLASWILLSVENICRATDQS